MNNIDHLEAIRRLAYFDPNITDEDGYQVIDYLVLDTLAFTGSLLKQTPEEIRVLIKKVFSIDYDEAEIILAAKRLHSKKILHYTEVSKLEGKHSLQLNNDFDFKNYNNAEMIKKIENDVFMEWENELIDKYKSQKEIKENLNKVISTFQIFLTKIFVRHGIESVLILYPNNDKSKDWLSSVQMDILKDLLIYDELTNLVLQVEIPLFLHNIKDKRKIYIESLFNASFYWHLLQVDDNCSKYFKETTNNQILVLDNNIIQSIMGFHGMNRLTSVHNLLNYANKLDCMLIVTSKTIEEFYESIKRKSEHLLKDLAYTRELARVAIEVLDESNFMVSYWKEYVKNGLTLQEFITEKTYLDNVLKGLSIEIVSDFRKEIEKSQELKDEESILRSSCGEHLVPPIVEHDAFHNIFIKKLRGGLKYKYTEAVAWFLTHDSKLPVYAAASHKGKKALPFCILSNEWIQINRPFIKRTADATEFEDSFAKLVTQPYLRSILKTFKADQIKEKLLNKLNKYENIGYELAFRMSTDIQFLAVTDKITDENKFVEKIKEEALEIKTEIIDENKKLEYSLKEKVRLVTNYEVDIQEMKNQLDTLQNNTLNQTTTIETLEKQIAEINKANDTKENEEINNLRNKVKELINDNTTSKEQVEGLKNDNRISKERYNNNLRRVLFFALFLIMTILIWSGFFSIDLIDKNPNYNYIKIIINITVFVILLNIIALKSWVRFLAIIVACILAIIGFLKI